MIVDQWPIIVRPCDILRSCEDTALPCHYKDDLSTIAVDREISEFTASGFAEERTDRTDGRTKEVDGGETFYNFLLQAHSQQYTMIA